MSTWKAVLATLTVFILGTIFGLVISTRMFPDAAPPLQEPPPLPRLHQLNRLLGESLSAEQKNEISKVLDNVRNELDGIRQETQPRIRKKMREARRQIWEILTPEQRMQFDGIIRNNRFMLDRPFRR